MLLKSKFLHEFKKLGVHQGMWGCVKKIEPGIRIYQAAQRQKPLSKCAMMARITSKVRAALLKSAQGNDNQRLQHLCHTEGET